VQGEIERALQLILRNPVRTVGAGRTDRGVHARGQVASFKLDQSFDCRRIISGIHGICGGDLRIRLLEPAPESFHARHDARSRTYTYRIIESSSALWRERAWHPPSLPSLPSLRRACRPLLGRHDFISFANYSPEQEGSECLVKSLDWSLWEEGFLFEICADRFLYKMVRNIVATLLREAGQEGGGEEAIASILARRNRREAAAPAPAEGLCLERVEYDPPWPQ
jgi:tRNA pseudouridine38-40 synthase